MIKYDINLWNDKLESLTGIIKKDFEELLKNLYDALNKEIFSKDENEIKKIMQNKTYL